MESELFGHSKGAFSGAHTARDGCFAAANGGTLFLDETGEMPLAIQPKLLRALESNVIRRLGESREIDLDLRVVAATNLNLQLAMEEQRFRRDLFFRLGEYQITIPPLRDRAADIPRLAADFLQRYKTCYGRHAVEGFSDDAMAWMRMNPWKANNVRELNAAIKRAILDCNSAVIEIVHLADGRTNPAPASTAVDKTQLRRALHECSGNIAATARTLGMSRSTLYDRLKRLDIQHLDGAQR